MAVKVIRANDTMYKAAQLEITILKKLMATDPDDKRHVVRFLRSFEFRDHAFMVFESMHANLRECRRSTGATSGSASAASVRTRRSCDCAAAPSRLRRGARGHQAG